MAMLNNQSVITPTIFDGCHARHISRSHESKEGNVGTAAYLDVFGSIYAVMKELQSPLPLPLPIVCLVEL